MNDFINETATKAIKLIQNQYTQIQELQNRWDKLRTKVESINDETSAQILEYMKGLEESK